MLRHILSDKEKAEEIKKSIEKNLRQMSESTTNEEWLKQENGFVTLIEVNGIKFLSSEEREKYIQRYYELKPPKALYSKN